MRGVGRGRRETEMDGVKSVAVQGHSYRRRQFTDAQRRCEERLWKNDKSRSWGRKDNEHDREEGVCLCVSDGLRPRGRGKASSSE